MPIDLNNSNKAKHSDHPSKAKPSDHNNKAKTTAQVKIKTPTAVSKDTLDINND